MSQDNMEYQLEDMAEERPANKFTQSRLWMLTINENCEEWKGKLDEYANYHLDQKLKYMCYCQEIAPSTGHIHLHVLLRYNTNQRFNVIQREFPNIHIDKCKGTLEQVFKYVTKDGNFKEYGEKPKSRKETGTMRWEQVTSLIKAGKNDCEILDAFPDFGTHINKLPGLRRALRDFTPKTFNGDLHSKCLWISGAAGTYKSHSVRAVAEELGLHIVDKDSHTQWFHNTDILDQNAVVLIDDLQPEHFKAMLGIIKNIADRYPQTQLPVKGGHAKMDGACRVVVTSNYSLREMLIKDDEHSDKEAGAIYRRFHEINIPTGAEYTKLEDTMGWVRDWFRQYPYRDETIEWFNEFLIPGWSHKLIYELMGKYAGNKDAVLEHLYQIDDGGWILDPCTKLIYKPNPGNSQGWEVDEDEPDEETEYEDSIVEE